jgi:methanesulfonate monooxygenase small subunit
MATLVKSRAEAAQAVRDLIYRAGLLLDEERFRDWLKLCSADFTYSIKVYSPEISRDMTWFERDVPGMEATIELMPKHNTDHGRLTRHATVYTVDLDGDTARAVTSFVCYRTMLDGINSHMDSGETQLFAVGKYYDRISLSGGEPKFVERVVRLETRRMDKGSHYPV